MDVATYSRDARCYINGKWLVGQGPDFESVNPATGRVECNVASASETQVDLAVSGARTAFDRGEWSHLTGEDRSRLLFRLADLLERDAEDLTRLIASETGSPISSGRGTQLGVPISFFRWFAESARRGLDGGNEQMLPIHQVPISSSSLLLREPAGVVAAITAYNVPIYLAAMKLGPAWASGCSAVLIPSPKAVLSTIAFLNLVEEAGFPPGAVNLVFGPPEVTEQVVLSEEVDIVSFTGSAVVGSKIMALAALSLKKVILELGGKSPNIVLPGTDLDPIIAPSALRFCINAGQRCGATTRSLVSQQDFNEFVERSAKYMGSIAVGDPLEEETVVGPLITGEHRAKVEGYLDRARKSGAIFATGGGRPRALDKGFYLEPTLIFGLDNEAEINQEELFAPVSTVIPYRDVDEAVYLANQSRYGLNANIWGPTMDALEIARRLRTGTVTINGGGGKRDDAPWGGYGASGIGRECGEEGLREFYETKHIQWPIH
jgi:aldehyde dehydrogenase (NAD+)